MSYQSKFFSSRTIRLFSFGILSFATVGTVIATTGCQSKSAQNTTAKNSGAANSESNPSPNVTPGSQPLSTRDLEGKAYSLDGQAVTARAIGLLGDNRRPMFLDQNRIVFANRRASLERWQVFEADLSKGVERRVSFDAGDAEPVAVFGRRLVIASSSDERKSGERVLNEYHDVFVPKEIDPAKATKNEGSAPALQHLMLEHPANGHKGTEWMRMSQEVAPRWIVSVDRDVKLALALKLKNEVEPSRITIATKSREPETRAWSTLKVELPSTAPKDPKSKSKPEYTTKISDGRIFPDGSKILWSNGSILWTTTTKGGEPLRLGDDSIPAAKDLAIDPTGQWIVFSSPTPSRGLNLMALHQSGRCLKTLTELPGDEAEPVFSPDGTTLLFTLKQGDGSVIAKIPFGTTAVIAAACPSS